MDTTTLTREQTMIKKSKKTKTHKKHKKTKLTKEQRKAQAKARAAAKKGDGSFPDILVVTKMGEGDAIAFDGHPGDDLSGLSEDGREVAVYKLRRVSTVVVNRKVAR